MSRLKQFFVAFIPVTMLSASGCATHTIKQNGPMLEFVMQIPEAKSVVLATSYDDFVHHPVQRNKDNIWSITLHMPLATQPIRYFTVIDGIPILPECPLREPDGFGGYNCLYELKYTIAENGS